MSDLLAALIQISRPTDQNRSNITWPEDFNFKNQQLGTWTRPGKICLAIFNSDTTICPFILLGIRETELDKELGLRMLYGLTLTNQTTSDGTPRLAPELVKINIASEAGPNLVSFATKEILKTVINFGSPGSAAANTHNVPKLIPSPHEWITFFTDTAYSAKELYETTQHMDFNQDQLGKSGTATLFVNWIRAAVTASRTDPTTSALSTKADFLSLDQVPDLETDLQVWLRTQIADISPTLRTPWTAAISPPTAATATTHDNRTTTMHNDPAPAVQPALPAGTSDITTPNANTTTDFLTAFAAMGDKLAATMGNKVATALQAQPNPASGLTPDQLVQVIANLTQMNQRNQIVPQEPPPPVSRLFPEQRSNLYGWSQLHDSEDLTPFWTQIDSAKSAKAVEIAIQYHLFPTLTTMEASFDKTILNKTLLTTIAEFAFVPLGKHLGLGPLACAFRPTTEITKLELNYQLLKDSTTVSVGDAQRVKLNTPTPPTDPASLAFLLRRLIALHKALFTPNCMLANHLNLLYEALCHKMGHYIENSHSFMHFTAPALLHALHNAISDFFEKHTTAEDIKAGLYPTISLTWLTEKITAGLPLDDTHNIPAMFYHPMVLKQRQQLPPAAPPRLMTNSLDGLSVVSALTSPTYLPGTAGAARQPLPVRTYPHHHATIASALTTWTQTHPNSPLPRLRDVLTTLKMDTNEALSLCNLGSTDCLRYVLLGTCGGRCNLTHTARPVNLPKEFIDQICVAIRDTRPLKRQRSTQQTEPGHS